MLTFLLALTAILQAGGPTLSVGSWTLERMSDGCVMTTEGSRGTQVKLYWLRDNDDVVYSLHNRSWLALKGNQRFNVSVVIGEEKYPGEARSLSGDTRRTLLVPVTEQVALAALASKATTKITIDNSGEELTSFRGEGRLQVAAWQNCKKAFSDPFAG